MFFTPAPARSSYHDVIWDVTNGKNGYTLILGVARLGKGEVYKEYSNLRLGYDIFFHFIYFIP